MPIRSPHDHVVIEQRFCGFPGLAHGGYVGGLMAAAVGGACAEVRLLRPVRAARRLRLGPAGGGRVELHDGETLVAEAAGAELTIDVPGAPSVRQAEEASRRYPGFDGHLYPRCFNCGPDRRHGDGLRIFPGPVAGRRMVAAPWVPAPETADQTGRVRGEFVWAAFDCPQIWSLILLQATDAGERAVTATLTARIDDAVLVGEPYVVIAWPHGRKDRKLLAGAALIAPNGRICATARQTAVVAKWG